MLTRPIILSTCFLCFFAALPSFAQEETKPTAIAVQQFLPSAGAGNFFSVEGSWLLPNFQLSLGLLSNLADDPLVARADTGLGEEQIRIIDSQVALNVLLAIGIGKSVELGIDLPVTVFQQGQSASSLRIEGVPSDLNSSGLGDLRLIPKIRLYGSNQDGLGIVLIPELVLPTGDKAAFLGNESGSFRPRAAIAYRQKGYDFAFNLGYRFRTKTTLGNLVVDDEIAYGAGAYVPLLTDQLGLVAEIVGSFGVQGNGGLEEIPLEGRLGAKAKLGSAFLLSGGFGTGFTEGFGSPDLRIFAGISWVEQTEGDDDQDGILNKNDSCPQDAEDKDQFEDDDGCPELDNDKDTVLDENDRCPLIEGSPSYEGCPAPDQDQDGISDEVDQCPAQPEDIDTFEDEDGCPELDNDKDGILEPTDACPDEAEDFDTFEDDDGCPELDNDKDGILEPIDICPDLPEDIDEFEDEDGCPDLDHDKDGILEPVDQCPNEAETFNGEEDEDGCPDSEEIAKLTDTKVEILQMVLFGSGSDKIKKSSYPLLDAVAAIVKLHPEITKLRIEGHTDNVGSKAYNLKLSQRRADEVMAYLVEKAGVSETQLISRGFGPSLPIGSNTSRDGRAQNRRVEFVIVEKDGVRIVPEEVPIVLEEEPKKVRKKRPKKTVKKPLVPVPVKRRK